MKALTSYYQTLSITLLLLGLSACSTFPPTEGSIPTRAEDLAHWQVRGKLSVVHANDSSTGYLTWQQHDAAYDIYLAGPFGAGSSRLQGNSQQASLLLPGWKQPQRANSAEALMQQHLGWNFPLHEIRYWVKGQIAPSSPATSNYDSNGLLNSLQQRGWNITFSRYQLQQGLWLPGLIKIRGYDYRFTFAVQEWNLYDH